MDQNVLQYHVQFKNKYYSTYCNTEKNIFLFAPLSGRFICLIFLYFPYCKLFLFYCSTILLLPWTLWQFLSVALATRATFFY